MFYTEPYHLQKGAGVFEVDRYPLQRGRGLGGIFANLLRKIIPYRKTFAKAAASTGNIWQYLAIYGHIAIGP